MPKDKKNTSERAQRVKAKVSAAAQSVKRTASNVADNVKAKVNRAAQTVKVKVKDYNAALQAAYDDGFQNGWEAHETLPKVPGARAAATVGYSKGIKARSRQEKSQKELEKSKRTTCSTRKQTAKR